MSEDYGRTRALEGGGVWGTYIERLETAEAERDAYKARIDAVRAIHRNAGPSQGYDSRYSGGYGMLGDCCETCGSHGEYGVEWPCPTILALEGGLHEKSTESQEGCER